MMLKHVAAVALAATLAISPANAGPNLSNADKATLQAAMFRSIDRSLVNGTYYHFDLAKTEIRNLYPSKAHPMILKMGDHFILCTDFRDAKGESVNVDFYLARTPKSFVVFHTAVDARKVVEEMMAAGKVAMVE